MKTVFAVLALSLVSVSATMAQTQDPNGNGGTTLETPDRINPFKGDFLWDKHEKALKSKKHLFINHGKPMTTKPIRDKIRPKK